MSHALLAELEDAFDRASDDDDCHVIVLSGNGSSFCAGDDSIGMSPESAPTLFDGASRTPKMLVEEYGSETAVWHQYNIEHDYMVGYHGSIPRKIRTAPKPTIALIHGYSIFMGFTLGQSCDIVLASADALFLGGQKSFGPEALFQLGPHKLREMNFEHRFMTAEEALEYRLANRVYPDRETLETEGMAMAYRIADGNPNELRRLKADMLHMEDVYGYATAVETTRYSFADTWRSFAADGHLNRHQGPGQARTPVALANLAAKLAAEGRSLPERALNAVKRAAERDDKAKWRDTLQADWRDPARVARARESRETYQSLHSAHESRKRAEITRRGLEEIWESVKHGTERVRSIAQDS